MNERPFLGIVTGTICSAVLWALLVGAAYLVG